jgi:hypothetical protein
MRRFIGTWGLRMSHICPCTPCPSPPRYRSKVESRHFAHLWLRLPAHYHPISQPISGYLIYRWRNRHILLLGSSVMGQTSVVDPEPHPDPDPHHFGNLDPHPDRIRIKKKSGSASNKNQDPDPHQFTDSNPKCMEYEPIRALFQGF